MDGELDTLNNIHFTTHLVTSRLLKCAKSNINSHNQAHLSAMVRLRSPYIKAAAGSEVLPPSYTEWKDSATLLLNFGASHPSSI